MTVKVENPDVIRARIEELTEAVNRHCPDCREGILAKWDLVEGRIHQGPDGVGGMSWLTFRRCRAEEEHRRIRQLQEQLDVSSQEQET